MKAFRVRYTLNFVNGDCSQPLSLKLNASSEDDAKRQVTREYILANVSDDWGVPIRNISITDVKAIGHARS